MSIIRIDKPKDPDVYYELYPKVRHGKKGYGLAEYKRSDDGHFAWSPWWAFYLTIGEARKAIRKGDFTAGIAASGPSEYGGPKFREPPTR